MKKIILCTSCAILFGTSVNALKFENRSDILNMKVSIEFDSPVFIKDIKEHTTKEYNTQPKITKIVWKKGFVGGETVCPINGLKTTDSKTIVFFRNKERDSCIIENSD